MKTGPGAWFVQTGCFVCHSISALGVKSAAQIGPDLSTAVEDVQSRFGRTIDDFLREPDRHDVGRAVAPDHPDARAEGRRDREAARGVRGVPEAASAQADAGRRASRQRVQKEHDHDGAEHVRDHAGRPRIVAAARWSPAGARRARQRAQGAAAGVVRHRPSPPRRPTSRPATSTSTTCSRRAATRARSTSTACRRCATSRRFPVFTPYPATGYGFDDDSKKMLGDLTWGDAHHPALSETKGDYDGRWLFINEMNGRVARIDLRDFKTKQILGPVPERLGQPRLVVRHAEHRIRDDGVALLDSDPEGHRRAASTSTPPNTRASSRAIKIDPKSGEMSLGWEILMPPFDYDLGDAGKLASDGWVFLTSYNTERATGKLEVTAIAARPRLHRGGRLARGREGRRRGQGRHDRRRQGARSEEGARASSTCMPCGKSPHGVDVSPDGKYIIGSGKLPGRHDGVQLREDPDRDPQQGLHGRRRRHPGPQVRVDQGRRSAGGPRPAAHAVRPGRLRLHVAVRRQRDRQVEARHVGSRRQDPDVVLDRPPDGRRGRHGQPGRQVPGRRSTSCRTAGTCRRAVAAGVVAARRHLRREDEAALRRVHRARAALRADHQGRQDPADRGVSEGREQAPAGGLGREGRRRHAPGQQGHRQDGRRALDASRRRRSK